MDNVHQKTALEIVNNQLEQEIGKRKQVEERVRILTEELAALKNQMAFNEAATEERIRFDVLLSEISTQFINLPSDQVDMEIEDAQRRVCDCLDLDVSALWQWTVDDPNRLIMTHLHRSMEGPPVPEKMDANEFFPWCQQELRSGRIISVSCMDNLPPEAAQDLKAWRQFDIKASLTIPLCAVNGPLFGGISFNDMKSERKWSDTIVKRLQPVAQIFANAIERKQTEERLRNQIQEIAKLKQQLEVENLYLHEGIKLLAENETIVGNSLAMKRILAEAGQVAMTDSIILILGETGTGKEILARAIHQMSKLKDRVMVTFNCASIPSTLIESELFGREAGAYTGAMTRMIGRFELADRSTLFLDEIGELPIEVQGKLLRVLEEGVFERLGSTRPIRVKARIIAATNRDIKNEVAKGRFRKDLFYRLNVFPIVIPPLRQRPEDIPLLVWAFVKEFQKRMGKKVETVSKKIMESLQSYYWPGNVRELRNVIERAMILSSNSTLVVQVPKFELKGKDDSQKLEDFEQKHIESVLERTGWRVAAAAKILGLKRSTLYSKMKRLGIIHPNL